MTLPRHSPIPDLPASPPSVLIIAEAGVNHNGSPDLALQLIDAAAEAGADAVKFQIFKTEKVLSCHAPKAEYQKQTTDPAESFLEMGRKLELSCKTFERLHDHCSQRGIAFLASPFDRDSLQFLVHNLRVTQLKIASGEITNGPLLLQAAQSGLPIILSTGMCEIGEIERALAVLAFGYIHPSQSPAPGAFQQAWLSPAGQQAVHQNISLLHCTTEYPSPITDVNLRAMDHLRESFGLPVGLSDHTQGIAVPIAAAARGAVIIEKHFTLDRHLPGPDHRASLEPPELKTMIRQIRTVEAALGAFQKSPAASELKNKPIARRSLVAAKPITKGELFSPDNLETKRPGTGICAMRYWEYLGRPADRNYETDDFIAPLPQNPDPLPPRSP